MLQGELFNGITKEKHVAEILIEKGCICHRGVLLWGDSRFFYFGVRENDGYWENIK